MLFIIYSLFLDLHMILWFRGKRFAKLFSNTMTDFHRVFKMKYLARFDEVDPDRLPCCHTAPNAHLVLSVQSSERVNITHNVSGNVIRLVHFCAVQFVVYVEIDVLGVGCGTTNGESGGVIFRANRHRFERCDHYFFVHSLSCGGQIEHRDRWAGHRVSHLRRHLRWKRWLLPARNGNSQKDRKNGDELHFDGFLEEQSSFGRGV